MPPCSGSARTTLSGTVYEPAGQLPIYNALVYVPNGALSAFTSGVSCEQCGASVSGKPLVIALTDANGRFRLDNVPVGSDIPLVIQVGRWRRRVQIPTVTACVDNPVSGTNLTRLPRHRGEGDIPQMAIASGLVDPLECLLLKMGISPAEFTPPSDGGRVHYYTHNGKDLPVAAPHGTQLYRDAGTLSNYDVVMLPCEGHEYPKDPAHRQNMVNYVSAGGRLFVTHFGYVWTADAGHPFQLAAAWNPDPGQLRNPPRTVEALVNQTFPKGRAFNSWLESVGAADGGQMTIREGKNNVGLVNPGTTAWLKGDYTGANPATVYNWTPHLTFNVPFNPPPLPDGGPGKECGRVLFSDFHVSTGELTGQPHFPASCAGGPYTAQEKALVFMLFDLSACIQNDNTNPGVCKAIGETCRQHSDCCASLECTPRVPGGDCSNGDCTCQPGIN